MRWSNVAEMVGISFCLFDLLRMKFKFCSFAVQYLQLFFHNQKNFRVSSFKFVDPPGPARHVLIFNFFRCINRTRKSAKRKHVGDLQGNWRLGNKVSKPNMLLFLGYEWRRHRDWFEMFFYVFTFFFSKKLNIFSLKN